MPGFPLDGCCLLAACPGSGCCAACRGIFGQHLEDTVHYKKKFGQHLVPLLVEQCVDFIRVCGLTEEGLFRLPGQANLVKDLQDSFDGGKKPQFDRMEQASTELRKLVTRLEEELIQEKKKQAMLEIKLRNSEGARKDAEKKNHFPQEEMEHFFTTLGSITAGSQWGKV